MECNMSKTKYTDAYSEGYQAGYVAALEQAAVAVEQHDKEGREWIMGSLLDTITREATARIRSLIPNTK